jgi:endonuclease/exonuclease/phosphatase family metal-dependent hydrolase
MSFNTRTTLGTHDGPEEWPNRRDLFVHTIAAAHPDVMGTQELTQIQGDYVVRQLPNYSWFGIDRRGGHADEHMGVFYRRDRLRLVRSGNFWLSETPDIVASNSWHTPFPRMATWGLFEEKAGHRRFYLFDTHLFYRAEDEPARTKGVRVLLEQMARIMGDSGLPVVVTGDFNTIPSSDAYKLLAAQLTDVRSAVPQVRGPEKTFHNFTGNPDQRIDWMFEKGFTPLSFATITTHQDSLYPSDHFPIFAVLQWSQHKDR